MNNMISSGSQIWVPEVLSDEQVTFFIENGYLAVSNLVSSDEVEELRTDKQNSLNSYLFLLGSYLQNLQLTLNLVLSLK